MKRKGVAAEMGKYTVNGIDTQDSRQNCNDIGEKPIEVEELRKLGVQDIPARSASISLRERIIGV